LSKFFIFLSLAGLMVASALTASAARGEASVKDVTKAFRANNYHQAQAIPNETRILRHNIRAILVDPRFNYPDRLGWLKKLWHTFHGWLVKLKLSKKPVDKGFWQKMLQWAGLACLAVLPFFLFYFLPKMFLRSGSVKRASATLTRTASVIVFKDLKDQAGIGAEKGQFREAIRLLYLAGLEYLKTNGILPDGIRLTDKANLTIISRTFGLEHPGYQAFRELVVVFQEKWYGLRNCQAEDYDQILEDLKIMEATMGKSHV
jgi:hypothetical protein